MIEKVKKESQQLFAIPTEDNINKCGVNLRKLSDRTRIAKTTWAKLKEYAMGENIHQQSWYFPLTSEEKELLNALISAR